VPRLPFPARLLSSPLTGVLLAALAFAGAPVAAAPQADELAAKAQQGKEAMAAGRFDEAAVLYGAIVRALPNEPGMRLNLGMALSMAGRPKEAVPHLQAALKLQPDLLPAFLFLGAAYADLGQPARAVESLQKFVAAQPDHREARQMLADALLTLERWEPAARHYRALTQQAPDDPKAWYGLERSYEGLSRRAFETLQETAPGSPYLSLLVAEAMVARERDKSAFPLYREAIAKKTRPAEAHEALARIYERAGHADWAAVEREKAKAVPPPDCRTPTLECEFQAGRYAKVLEMARPLGTAASRYWTSRAADALAREAFDRLTALPPSPEAALVRVEVFRAQRRYAQSKEELQKAAAAWPEDRRIRREQANLHFIAHEYAEARPLLEELLKQEPDSAELNLLLGDSWLESREVAKAIPPLEKAVEADPKLLRARAALGRAYVEDGQAARGVPHLEAALLTDEDGSLHLQLARAYRETGRPDEAARTLAAFQELRKANEARLESDKEEFAITPP
jgi:predicted Zn-dependent protease